MERFAGNSVLIVEDDFLIALDLETFLGDHGCTVVGPENSVASGLAALESSQPQFALLDVNLGTETSGPIADALAARDIPFLFLTGHSHEALPQAHAARPHLHKPWNQRNLLSALAALME